MGSVSWDRDPQELGASQARPDELLLIPMCLEQAILEHPGPWETSLALQGSRGRKRARIICIWLRLENQRGFKTPANLTTNLFFKDIPEVKFSDELLIMPSIHTQLITSGAQKRVEACVSIHPFIYSFGSQEISTEGNHVAGDEDTIISNIRQSLTE